MKEDFNDIEFKKLLKEQAQQPGENPWFTPRLLNRLPEKQETNVFSIEKWIYAVGMILCVICWGVLYSTGYFNVITVRSLIYIIALAVGSFTLLIQTIRSTFSL